MIDNETVVDMRNTFNDELDHLEDVLCARIPMGSDHLDLYKSFLDLRSSALGWVDRLDYLTYEGAL